MTTRRGLHGECAVRDTFGVRWAGSVPADGAWISRTVHRELTQEKWMKLVKTSAIAFALSAMLAGPVLAQGASSDTHIRGGAQGRSNMQGGTSGSGDEEFNAQGAPGEKAGAHAK